MDPLEQRSQAAARVTPLQGLTMGGLIAAVGLAIVFVSLGWIPVDPASVRAPMWVLGVLGVMFFLPGLLLCYYGLRNGLRPAGAPLPKERKWGGPGWFVSACIITGFGATFGWVGFGPGERQFGGGLTGTETEGRLVFGSVGLACSLLALWVWYRGLKEIFRRGR